MTRKPAFRIELILMTMMVGLGFGAFGAEYFVNKNGNDANDGLSRGKAFATIQKGVDALNEGDVLTIAPGEYFEHVARYDIGGPDKDTVIRAEIPGTVLMRGDVSAPEFKPVEGFQFVYSAPFDGDVQAVNEVDTMKILQTEPNVGELEFVPGGCHYDDDAKRLYISTSDLRPPETHHYTVATTKNYGLFLGQPKRVVVDGLSFTGFNSAECLASQPGMYSIWGLMLAGAEKCVVRDCHAFMNAGGIAVNSGHFGVRKTDANQIPVYRGWNRDVAVDAEGPGGNLVENCRAYGNYSRHCGSGGNICVYNSRHDTIRNCVAHDGAAHGIRHYGGVSGPAVMSGNLSWGNAINDIHIKGGRAPEFGLAERCVTLGPLHVKKFHNCVIGGENRYNANPDATNVRLDTEEIRLGDFGFADPDNLDFRLQADSKLRGAGPNGVDRGAFQYEPTIFYVKSDGDDKADGLSMSKAWKTLARGVRNLRPGDTLYLAAGTYAGGVEISIGEAGKAPVRFRGRGRGAVIIGGAVSLAKCADIEFERLNFSDAVSVGDSQSVKFANCRFKTLRAEGVDGLDVTHCAFAGFDDVGLDLTKCSNVFLAGNIFDNPGKTAVRVDRAEAIRYCDYNGYRDATKAWRVGGASVPLDAKADRRDRYSLVVNRDRFSTGGPNGTPLGPYRILKEKGVSVSDPTLHSATPTSANIEWRTSRPARCRLAWGTSPKCENELTLNSDFYGSCSLTGLKPGKNYWFKILDARPVSDYFRVDAAKSELTGRRGHSSVSKVLSFKTPLKAAEPVTYHVAPDGNDQASGLSREQAFRTISKATSLANAGDTVLIHGGVYKETARIRSTGLPDRPITIKSAPGEKAILDGDEQTLAKAFMAIDKDYLVFDGLYFQHFSPGSRSQGIFALYDCDDVTITRCFYDGRVGYSPPFVKAKGCADLHVKNCVAANVCYGAFYLVKCPDAVLENNVLLRSLILECVLVNEPDQKVTLKNNIITDNVPHKVKVPLMEIACLVSLDEGNNCFHLRIPANEKNLISLYDSVAYDRAATAFGLKPLPDSNFPEKLEKLTLPQFQKASGNSSSIAKDPLLKGTLGMKRVNEKGEPVFLAGKLLGKKDLDFPDFLATDPDVVERGIGLEPKAFKDFQFNKQRRGK